MDKYLGGGHWLNRGIIWKCFGVDCDKICRVIRCGDGRKGQSPGENPGMWEGLIGVLLILIEKSGERTQGKKYYNLSFRKPEF